MRISRAVISALCLMVLSCQQDETFMALDASSGFTAEIESFADATKTLMNENHSIEWSENDRIAVFQGSSIADLFEVTASSVGRTNGTFREVTEYEDDFVAGNELGANVAVYPYIDDLVCSDSAFSDEGEINTYKIENVVVPSVQFRQPSSFPDNAFVMIAVTGGVNDRRLKFRNVSGALRLKVRGDAVIKTVSIKGNSGEPLSGPATIYAFADNAREPSISMSASASKIITLDCGSGVRLNPSSSVEFILALPPTTFYKGFSVTLTDINGVTSEHRTEKFNSVGRSKILNMPEIVFGVVTGELEAGSCTDIAEKGTANCYVVSSSGDYSFPTVKGNSAESVGTVSAVEVLWESFGTSVQPDVSDLISEVAYEDGQILFRVPSDFREGNAVIAALDSGGTILWSWHIWLTDQPEEQFYISGAVAMMDRNLGATSAVSGEVGALGLLYQWGRKDPFLGSSSLSYNESAKSAGRSWPSSVTTSASKGTISYVTAHPMQYVTGKEGNDYDWIYVGGNDDLWGVPKTVYDPCPPGWTVPDPLNWYLAGFDTDQFRESYYGAEFKIYSPSSTWYPAAGLMYAGQLYEVGTEGYYWSCNLEDSLPVFMYLTEDPEYQYTYYIYGRSYACSVRCQKEDSFSQESANEYIDEYGVNHGEGIKVGGVVWAPVNCGYHQTDFPYGKLYQWGRKYGQGYDGPIYDIEGYYKSEYADSYVPEIENGPVSLRLGQSAHNDDCFYKCVTDPFDWLSYPDDGLWNSGTEENPVKTEYDPCPDGWRVPTYSELDDLHHGYSSWTTDESGQIGYWFSGSRTYSPSVPSVFFPAAGARSNYADPDSRGYYGLYWSSTSYGSKAYHLCFFRREANIYTVDRACAFAVRCVQE